MEKIINYLLTMGFFMSITLPFAIIYRYLRQKRGVYYTREHMIGSVLFIIFLVGLSSLTILPGVASEGIDPFQGNVNLELFKVFHQTYLVVIQTGSFSYFYINFIGNIVIFIPIGFFIALLFTKKNVFHIMFYGFLCSLFIEVAQLFIARGSDVDDLWLNTLGAILGYGIYLIYNKFYPDFCTRCKQRIHRNEQ